MAHREPNWQGEVVKQSLEELIKKIEKNPSDAKLLQLLEQLRQELRDQKK